jgi:hypothetical protein
VRWEAMGGLVFGEKKYRAKRSRIWQLEDYCTSSGKRELVSCTRYVALRGKLVPFKIHFEGTITIP